MKTSQTEKVLVSYLPSASGQKVAVLTLHKEKALNALDLDMVQIMQSHLDQWRDDQSIAAIFIDSAGDRAFCAGGDIVSLYESMLNAKASPLQVPEFIKQFFAQEYRLDYTIHVYPKPIICWGNGIIMGGGLGIFAAAKHKVVTQSVHVAMPEITIGLFPDVGASYFLNKMPPGVGKLLGLTAFGINAFDCIKIGLADYKVEHQCKQDVLMALSKLQVIDDDAIESTLMSFDSVTAQVDEHAKPSELVDSGGKLSGHDDVLIALDSAEDLTEVESILSDFALQHPENKALAKAQKCFLRGSPITAHLVLEQLRRAKSMSLAECFKMELSIAYQCGARGEFQEGVRALLIDKDNQANWQYSHHSEVPQALIDAHFTHFNQNEDMHPLKNLIADYGDKV